MWWLQKKKLKNKTSCDEKKVCYWHSFFFCREGIDFIIDSMGNPLCSDLVEHVDGVRSYYKAKCFLE